MAHCNTVLSQLIKLIPRHEFERLANQVDGQVRSTALSRWSQFLALTVGQLNGRQSLRDIESCLSSQVQHHYHLGMQSVSKSALGRANEKRSYDFYAALFELLYKRCCQGSSRHGFRFKNKLFSLDGSLLDVSMKLFPWADYNRQKSAFKLHLGLDHDGLIPCFVRVTEGKVSENAMAYEFITNHFNWSAQTIADIYKQRWQVELFFKWIKQNLKIKSFLGNSKNAVLTQVLAALCVYLVVAYLKFSAKVCQSMQQICRLLHTNLFIRRDLATLFVKQKPNVNISPQMILALARR